MDPLQKHAIRILEFLNKGHFVAARIYLIKHLKQSTASGGGTNHNAHLASFLNCLIELINNSSAAGPAVSADQTPVFPHISLLSVAAPSNSPQDQESLARISVLLDELYKRRIMDYLALVRLCYTCIKAESLIKGFGTLRLNPNSPPPAAPVFPETINQLSSLLASHSQQQLGTDCASWKIETDVNGQVLVYPPPPLMKSSSIVPASYSLDVETSAGAAVAAEMMAVDDALVQPKSAPAVSAEKAIKDLKNLTALSLSLVL